MVENESKEIYLTPLAHNCAVNGDTGKPESANSIAGCNTSARDNLPHRLIVSHQPAHAPLQYNSSSSHLRYQYVHDE
jgi:hypothetical protein